MAVQFGKENFRGRKSTDEAQLYLRKRGSRWERGREGGRQDTSRYLHISLVPPLPTGHPEPAGLQVAVPQGHVGFANTLSRHRDTLVLQTRYCCSQGASMTSSGSYEQPPLKSVPQQLHFKS